MTISNKNLIIFTGQSGIQAKKCLSRLNNPEIKNLNTFYIEDRIKEIYESNFKIFLSEPIPYQSETWKEAYGDIEKEITKIPLESNIFLSMHASYYHQGTCELISIINFESLLKLKSRVKCIIVLIDDIYDIYKRLVDQGQMFNDILGSEDAFEAIYNSIKNYISILKWRQLETNISRLLSKMFETKLFIVAIKHPIFLIRRIIDNLYEQLNIFYLAHPISAIRRKSVDIIPGFASEINNFAKTIIDNNDKNVMFLPGSIDELRIKEKKNNDHKMYIPDLHPRLDLPYGKKSQIGPPLVSRLEKYDEFNPAKCKMSVLTSNDTEKISGLLELLSDLIRLQVTSRDINLINQSKSGLIAYRPYFPEKISGGVVDEIKYNYTMCNIFKERTNIIVSIKHDLSKARILGFFELLIGRINGLDDIIIDTLQDKRDNWIIKEDILNMFSDEERVRGNFDKILSEIEPLLPSDYVFKGFKQKHRKTFTTGIFPAIFENRNNNYEEIRNNFLVDELPKWVKPKNYYKFDVPTDIIIQKILNKP
ncbi:MAG: hypothetical protein V3V33_14235 [Candidatus Lokiarchaeia archaeon]